MTKKDYEKIVKALHEGWEYSYGLTHNHKPIHHGYVNKMAEILAADNPRFDREKFLKACGIED